jgi:hypothetical protein
MRWGAPMLNPVEFCGVRPEGHKILFYFIFLFFYFFSGMCLLGAGGPAALRRVACQKKIEQKFPFQAARQGTPQAAREEFFIFYFL